MLGWSILITILNACVRLTDVLIDERCSRDIPEGVKGYRRAVRTLEPWQKYKAEKRA